MVTRREETRALIRLLDTFDATLLLQVREHLPRTYRERLAHQLTAEDRERDRHAEDTNGGFDCPLYLGPSTQGHDCIPAEFSPARLDPEGRCAVLFPAPCARDMVHGELGWSQGERLLADHLRRCGIPASHVAWIPLVGCAPTDAEGHQRPPTADELAAHWPTTLEYLDAADVRHVLLHGTHAVRAWRGDLKVTEQAGIQGLMLQRWFVTPIPHATAVLRPNGLPITEWSRWVTDFSQRVTENVGLEGLGTRCVKCGAGLYAYDADGIALCEEHFISHRDKGEKIQRTRQRKIAQQNQGRLL